MHAKPTVFFSVDRNMDIEIILFFLFSLLLMVTGASND